MFKKYRRHADTGWVLNVLRVVFESRVAVISDSLNKNNAMEKPKQTDMPADNQSLKDINIHINEFGQIVRDVKLEEINAFLDENVPDKKLDENEGEITT